MTPSLRFVASIGALAAFAYSAASVAASTPLGVSGAAFPVSECAECLTDEAPVVAGSKAGTFVAFWFRPTGGQFRADFLARTFDATGAPAGLRRINESNPTAQIRATRQTAGSDAAGEYVVLWQHPGLVRAQRLEALGNPLGGQIFVNQVPAGDDDDHPILQVHPDRSFDVFWVNHNTATGRFALGVRRVAADDSVGPPRQVDAGVLFPAAGGYRSCRFADGETVVVWETGPFAAQPGGPTPPRGVSLRRLDATGVPVGAEVGLVAPTLVAPAGLQAQIDCLSDKSFVLVYATNQSPAKSGFDIVARRFDANGKPLAAAKLLNTPPKGDQTGPVIEALGKGEFVAAWVSKQGASSSVVARRFKSNLAPRGAEVRIAGPVSDVLRAVHLDKLGTGSQLVAAWWQGIGAGPQGRGWARFLAARR